jgi:hypothetical protein
MGDEFLDGPFMLIHPQRGIFQADPYLVGHQVIEASRATASEGDYLRDIAGLRIFVLSVGVQG